MQEWTGEWSDSDSSHWTSRMRQRLGYDPAKSGDDGVFWMSFRDFCVNFEQIFVCHLYKTVSEGGKWSRYVMQGEWRGKTAGGCTNNPTAINTPQYLLRLKEPTTVHIYLKQRKIASGKSAAESREWLIIGAFVFKCNRRVSSTYAGARMLYAPYSAMEEAAMQGSLNAGNYVVFVSAFEADKEAEYTLTVLTDRPLEVDTLDPATTAGPQPQLLLMPEGTAQVPLGPLTAAALGGNSSSAASK